MKFCDWPTEPWSELVGDRALFRRIVFLFSFFLEPKVDPGGDEAEPLIAEEAEGTGSEEPETEKQAEDKAGSEGPKPEQLAEKETRGEGRKEQGGEPLMGEGTGGAGSGEPEAEPLPDGYTGRIETVSDQSTGFLPLTMIPLWYIEQCFQNVMSSSGSPCNTRPVAGAKLWNLCSDCH